MDTNRFAIRVFKDAAFVIDRLNNRSFFVKGPLSSEVSQIVDNLGYQLSRSLLLEYNESDRNLLLAEFELLRSQVKDFVNGTISDEDSEVSLIALEDFAKENWQITSVSIELTHQCNHRCQWCYLEDFQSPGLTFEELKRIGEEAKEVGACYLLLTGGEVFIRQDAIDILKMYDDMGFTLEVKTNGTLLTPQIIKRLSTMGIGDVQVSVYETVNGFSPLTQSRYNFDRVVQNINLLQEAGVPTSLSVMTGKHNIGRIRDIHKMIVSRTGIKPFYGQYITPNRKGKGPEINLRLSLAEMRDHFLPFLKEIGELPIPPSKYRDCDCDNTVCYAGRDQIAIGPDGIVYPCLDLRVALGNLCHENMQTIVSRRKEMMSQFSIREIPVCLECDIRDYCDSCIGISLCENGDWRQPVLHKCDVMRCNMNPNQRG